jgi:hypothetical protein
VEHAFEGEPRPGIEAEGVADPDRAPQSALAGGVGVVPAGIPETAVELLEIRGKAPQEIEAPVPVGRPLGEDLHLAAQVELRMAEVDGRLPVRIGPGIGGPAEAQAKGDAAVHREAEEERPAQAQVVAVRLRGDGVA